MLDTNTLKEWKHLSLQQRCAKLLAEKNVKIVSSTLREFYLKNKVQYSKVKPRKVPTVPTPDWQESKFAFCAKLTRLIYEGQPIVYFDETTAHSWIFKDHIWRRATDDIAPIQPRLRIGSVTIYGAMGTCIRNGLFTTISSSTNQLDFARFIQAMRDSANCAIPKTKTIYLVLDNHSAHQTKFADECMRILNIEPVRMPTYSPELNSIEVMWAHFKKKMQVELLSFRDPDNLTDQVFKNMVLKVTKECADPQLVSRLLLSNRHFVQKQVKDLLLREYRRQPALVAGAEYQLLLSTHQLNHRK